jgi:putative effector of murein hydrolase
VYKLSTLVKYKNKILLLCLFAFVIIITIANSEYGSKIFSFIRYIPGEDRTGHFVVFATICFVVNLWFEFKYIKVFDKPILVGSVVTLLVAMIEEFSQIFIETRTFDLYDLLADILAIAFISIIIKRYIK